MKEQPKISIWDNEKDIQEYPDGYILASEGIFEKRSNDWISHMTKVDEISELPALGHDKIYLKVHMPKIPVKLFYQAWEFFRRVHDEHDSEAIVLLVYSQKDGYMLIAPKQTVSSSTLDYNTDEAYNIVGTIHSHNTMSAFHSGVDDADELNMDGIHITLGNVDESSFPSISVSMMKNSNRFMFRFDELFDLGNMEGRDFDIDKAMENVTKKRYGSYSGSEYGNYDKTYPDYGEQSKVDDWRCYDKKSSRKTVKKVSDDFDIYLEEQW